MPFYFDWGLSVTIIDDFLNSHTGMFKGVGEVHSLYVLLPFLCDRRLMISHLRNHAFNHKVGEGALLHRPLVVADTDSNYSRTSSGESLFCWILLCDPVRLRNPEAGSATEYCLRFDGCRGNWFAALDDMILRPANCHLLAQSHLVCSKRNLIGRFLPRLLWSLNLGWSSILWRPGEAGCLKDFGVVLRPTLKYHNWLRLELALGSANYNEYPGLLIVF